VSILIPVKLYAGPVFAGLMGLYMLSGVIINAFFIEPFELAFPFVFTWSGLGTPIEYTIPFVFVWEGMILAVLISMLWGVFFGKEVIRTWRYFPRLILFLASLLFLLALCLLVFFAMPTEWAKLWLLVAFAVCAVIAIISIIGEIHYKTTGKRYTEMLRKYKGEE